MCSLLIQHAEWSAESGSNFQRGERTHCASESEVKKPFNCEHSVSLKRSSNDAFVVTVQVPSIQQVTPLD